MKPMRSLLALLMLLPAAALFADTEVLHMEIGDPERRGREVAVALDGITDSRSGELLTPDDVAARLNDVRVLLVGESHTDIEFHRAQLKIIQALHRAGREVLIGLEMYPYTEQKYLDNWGEGVYTESGFLQASDWYESWGYHWNYYREIFFFARDNGLPMFAVNTPREVVRAVRKKGFEDLTEEEAAHLPTSIDTDDDEHFRLFKAYFSEDDGFHSEMSDQMWQGMFAAQCTWDATMGYNAVQALEKFGGPDSIMVVLVGSGHVGYGLGIQRQASGWFDGRVASLIPLNVRDDDDDPVESVRASYADFVWGVPAYRDPIYPVLGVSTRELEEEARRIVIDVAEDSVGERAGFQVDDVLLSIDGKQIHARGEVMRLMAEKRWGDRSIAEVRRGEETVTLEVLFRRLSEEEEGEEE